MLRSSFLYTCTIAFLFLIAFFSLPITGLDAESSKVLLFVVWGIVALVGGAIGAFREKLWLAPFRVSMVGLSATLAILLVVVSAFFSKAYRMSFLGDGYAIGVPLFMFTALALAYVVSRFAKDSRRSGVIFLALFGGIALITCVAFLTMLLRPFIGFSNHTVAYLLTAVSKWNDLGIYAGMLLIASLFSIRKFALSGAGAGIAYVMLALSIVMLGIINLIFVWTALFGLTVIGLAVLVFKKKFGSVAHAKIFWIMSILAVISFVFVLDNHFGLFKGKVAGVATTVFNVSSVEAYPSLASTLSVTRGVLSQSPLFGFGPGRFADAWRIYRPQEVNLSQFWATDFTYGVGLWPTFLVTSGAFGFMGIIIFVATVLYSAVRVYRKSQASEITSFISQTVSLSVVFLTFVFFVYSPGFGGAIVYVALLGIMVGLSYKHETSRIIEIKLLSRWNMLGLGTLIAVLVLAAGSLWAYGTKVYAGYTYNKAVLIPANDTHTIGEVIQDIQKALMADPRDIYARALGQASFLQFNNILVNESSAYTPEELRNMLLEVVRVSSNAVIANPLNSLNYLYMAELYRSIHANGVSEALVPAQEYYEAAIARDPHSPLIRVLQARLAIQDKDTQTARAKLEEAVALKPNYTEAVFLLSQLLVDEGEADEAVAKLETRAQVGPVEPIVFFQLGFLKYAQKDYTGAIQALEAAVSLVPEYSNALYFLGLSYYYEDRDPEAIAMFERIIHLNPESEEAKTVLANMKVGRAPFAGTAVIPEKREDLPVDEAVSVPEE